MEAGRRQVGPVRAWAVAAGTFSAAMAVIALFMATVPGSAALARATVAATASMIGSAVSPWSAQQHQLAPPSLPAAGVLQDGDIVLRRGRDALASAVLALDPESGFSHVGMIVMDEQGLPGVIHAMPSEGKDPAGVIQQSLPAFAAPEVAADLAFLRLDGLTHDQQQRMRAYLLSQLGKPFDPRFALSSDDAIYCTELVIKALQLAGRHIELELPGLAFPTLTEPVFAPGSMRQLAGIGLVGVSADSLH